MKIYAAIALVLVSSLHAESEPMKTEKATLGGGCFWCVEAVYERLPGILSVTSGYAGGQTENPTYEQIGTGKTGHAEVVQIEYDPAPPFNAGTPFVAPAAIVERARNAGAARRAIRAAAVETAAGRLASP